MSGNASLATGADLTPETWADFVERLRHDCRGAGVKRHGTAAALFIVEHQRTVYGFEADYAEGMVVIHEESVWFSPAEYWADLDDEERADLHRKAQDWCSSGFMDASQDDQWYLLGELDDHTVTGWNKRWEAINSHFTRDAAEAFIRRKQHDYGQMRVNVDSQHYAWEFEAIKNAILDGRLVLSDEQRPSELRPDGVNISDAPSDFARPEVPPPPPPRC